MGRRTSVIIGGAVVATAAVVLNVVGLFKNSSEEPEPPADRPSALYQACEGVNDNTVVRVEFGTAEDAERNMYGAATDLSGDRRIDMLFVEGREEGYEQAMKTYADQRDILLTITYETTPAAMYVRPEDTITPADLATALAREVADADKAVTQSCDP